MSFLASKANQWILACLCYLFLLIGLTRAVLITRFVLTDINILWVLFTDCTKGPPGPSLSYELCSLNIKLHRFPQTHKCTSSLARTQARTPTCRDIHSSLEMRYAKSRLLCLAESCKHSATRVNVKAQMKCYLICSLYVDVRPGKTNCQAFFLIITFNLR